MKLTECQIAFTALADRTRLRILNLLGQGELCVCDLMKVLKEPQSKVSRHLAYLRKAELVEARKEGLWMHYKLSEPNTRIIAAILRALDRESCHCEELKRDLAQFNKSKGCLIGCCP